MPIAIEPRRIYKGVVRQQPQRPHTETWGMPQQNTQQPTQQVNGQVITPDWMRQGTNIPADYWQQQKQRQINTGNMPTQTQQPGLVSWGQPLQPTQQPVAGIQTQPMVVASENARQLALRKGNMSQFGGNYSGTSNSMGRLAQYRASNLSNILGQK